MPKTRTEISKDYNKENITQFNIALNNKTDADCLEALNRVSDLGQPKADYVKGLIRKDIRNRFPDINILKDIKNNS